MTSTPIQIYPASNGDESDTHKHIRDVTRFGIWAVSSFQLRENAFDFMLDSDNLDTFWLSSALQPPWLLVRFPKIMNLVKLSLYLDAYLDSGLCPQIMSISAGLDMAYMQDIYRIEYVYSTIPHGWQDFDIREPHGPPLQCTVLKISFEQIFQSGIEMRLRGIKLFDHPAPYVP